MKYITLWKIFRFCKQIASNFFRPKTQVYLHVIPDLHHGKTSIENIQDISDDLWKVCNHDARERPAD